MTLRPCIERDCPRLTTKWRCDECHEKRTAKKRAAGERQGAGPTSARKARRRALIRDGYRCVKCGAPYPLEVDHINGDWTDNRDENLQTLCVKCHHEKHGNAVDPAKLP